MRPLLMALALAVGLAGGLLYTWVLDPVECDQASPDSLAVEEKLVYLGLIGDLYACENDLTRARARLAELGVRADGPTLARLIELYLDGGGRPEEVRNLARLARDLGAVGGVLLVFGPEPAPSPSPTFSPVASPPASVPPPPTPTATPAPTFRLIEQTATCADPGRPGRLRVWVQDAAGNGLGGIEIVASWAAGQDRFFTGLRPEQGAGYADLEMRPQTEYEVALAGFRGDMARGLSPDLSSGTCPTGTVALDWHLTFQRLQQGSRP